MAYTLPPFTKPCIALSRKPSLDCETSDPPDALVSGVELIVSKLPRNSISSAADHLRAILGQHSLQHPSDPLVPVRIVPGDERYPVDYVFVSVDSATQGPRPDLLEKMRTSLTFRYRLQVDWKVGEGPDPTRRVYFQLDSFGQAEALFPKLTSHLNGRGCSFQRSFVSKAMNRVTFDLLDRASVDDLLKTPPVIDHQTLCPSVPRYIQPVYGLEVVILGVKTGFKLTHENDIQALMAFERNITSKYGDVLVSSRLALNGDALCVAFKTWAQTSRFLSDPFTAFDSEFEVSHQTPPALLYVLNSNNLSFSPRPSDSPNTSLRQLQAQFDMLQQEVDTRARVLEALVGQQRVSQQLQDNAQNTAAFIAGLSAVISGSHLQAATSRLQALQSDVRSSRLLLAFVPPDSHNALVQHLQDLQSEIAAQQSTVAQAQEHFSAAERLLSSLAPSSLLSPPAPSPRTVSTSQALRTRTLDDPHAETDGDERRLRARTDAGPSLLRDDSSIRVDLVTHLASPPSSAHFPIYSPGYLTPSSLSVLHFPFPRVFWLRICTSYLCLSSIFSISVLPTQRLNLFSIANGLHDDMKTHAIKQHISTSLPHVWTMNETKYSLVASRVFVPGV